MHNAFIDLTKWPIALCLATFAWFAAGQLAAQFMLLAQHYSVCIPLACGLAGFALSWYAWLRSNRTAAWLRVMEHECTHVLASLVTFNGVHRLHAEGNGTGHVAGPHSGNWIVLLAPYVFPTSLLVPALVVAAAPSRWISYVLFGAALGFHIQTTWTETHAGQTDLRKVGWLATTLLLPACHIVVALAIIGWLNGNEHGMNLAWQRAKVSIASAAVTTLPSRKE